MIAVILIGLSFVFTGITTACLAEDAASLREKLDLFDTAHHVQMEAWLEAQDREIAMLKERIAKMEETNVNK